MHKTLEIQNFCDVKENEQLVEIIDKDFFNSFDDDFDESDISSLSSSDEQHYTQSDYVTPNSEQSYHENTILAKDNEINIPADGDCLYTSIFLGFLLPVIHEPIEFNTRLSILNGEHRTNNEKFQAELSQNFNNIQYLWGDSFKQLIKLFKTNIGLSNNLWGGTSEIKIISKQLGIAIQEVYENPDSSQSGASYIISDLVQNEEQQELSHFEKIFILHTNPKPEEVLSKVDDAGLQIAKTISANTSKNLQHYRLVSVSPTLNTTISCKENKIDELDYLGEAETPTHNLDAIRFARTYSDTVEMLQNFERIFYPQKLSSPETFNTNIELKYQVLQVLTGHKDPTSLLARIDDFLGDILSPSPQLKSSEHRTSQEIMLRIGMLKRPDYFTSLTQEEFESQDAEAIIFLKFIKEFVQSGALDQWLQKSAPEIIANMGDINQEAALEFMNIIADFLRHFASDDFKDPKLDPLNKYVDPEDIDFVLKTKEWLENNLQDSDYNSVRRKFSNIMRKVQKERMRAMKDAADYMASLTKRLDPKHSTTESNHDLMKAEKAKWKHKNIIKFEKYILEEFKLFDIFEPNQIRAFWETLYRQQYGKIFYRYVCKSFEPQYEASEVHQKIYQIWAISLLDTIHYQPQEAKSRMPNGSIDGLTAPNFGYAIERSPAFQSWITNSLVRATADIIIDAFHYVVDFGRNLNIDIFLERLQIHLSEDKKIIYDSYRSPHIYDRFMVDFELYLLDKIFNKPFIYDGKRKIPLELKNIAGNESNLIESAKQVLVHFVNFCKEMFALRPTNEQLQQNELYKGLVFGIGYNGKKFNSLNPSNKNEHQIWLTFSESGRNKGGYLFLTFLKHVAKNLDITLLDSVVSSFASKEYHFTEYKSLIKRQIDQKIKQNYYVPDLDHDRETLEYIQKKRNKFEGFMAELEQDFSFKQLTPKFKKWIRNISNWYYIPSDITIQIPKEMPKEEYKAQEHAREFLFDALVKRPFSSRYKHNLMPLLFLHWKKNIVKLLTTGEFDNIFNTINISSQHLSFWNNNNSTTLFNEKTELIAAIIKTQSLDNLSDRFKEYVLILLDNFIWKVHPELESIWNPTIQEYFESFMKPKYIEMDSKLRSAHGRIKKFEKNSKNPKITQKAIDELTKKIEEDKKLIEQTNKEKLDLPKSPSNLTEKDYNKFKDIFFEERDVAQCIEPVFARVLGHDRFFSVFISKKTGQTVVSDETNLEHRPLQLGNWIPQDVIAPCHKRCQHHALGHLYTGDLLSYQSADRLDEIRQTHKLGEVPDRVMTFKK